MIEFIRTIRDDCRVSESDIAELEKRVRIKIPDVLKEFYLKFNGSDIYLCQFSMDDLSVEPFEIHIVYPIKHCATPYGVTLEHVIDGDRADGFIPSNLIPFAEDQGGDRYYYDQNTENIFWIPSDDIDNPEKVCDNFVEFFDNLSRCDL